MKTRMMVIVAMIGVIAMAGTANAYVYLVDVITDTGTYPVATAAEFAAEGVAGLTGTEPVDTLNAGGGAGTYPTAGEIDVTFGGTHTDYEVSGVGNLRGDYVYLQSTTMGVSIGNVALDPSTVCTLYLWGNINGNPHGWNEDAYFTPVDGDVTFASTATVSEYLAVNFTTNAAWDDVNDTIEFTWGPTDVYGDLNAFAITGPGEAAEPIPEPAGLGLIGLALLAVRKKRS